MDAPLRFHHAGQPHQLSWGRHFSAPREEGFRDTPASELTAIVAEIHSGRPWREIIDHRFAATKPWLHQIVTSPLRTAFLAPVLSAPVGPVLDIGSGWGQIARPLARDRHVVALEPVAERLAFIAAAARQDSVHDRLAFVESDYFEISFETRFAAICAIGVLEWAGAFQSAADPQQRQRDFLRKTRAELAPHGQLILGIENRLGLKYLLGAPDDHIGVPNIACLPAALAAPRWQHVSGHTLRSFTYSHTELRDLLTAAGFTQIEFFAAFPDYKLPAAIVPFGENGATLNAWLCTHTPPADHNGYDGSALSSDLVAALAAHYRSLADEGVAHAFVPSFFVRAS
jgi:Cyclopropane fatty acid synthase and related methyltransferases